MLGVNNGGTTESLFPINASDPSCFSTSSIEEQWKNNPQELLQYKNLRTLVHESDVVRCEQGGAFFSIIHPSKVDEWFGKSTLGWKLHISVAPTDHEKAFNLAAPIISRYLPYFKVTNPKNVHGDRLSFGMQITIYLQENGKNIIPPEDVKKMVQEIDQVFLENKIQPGTISSSDAQMISPYFSMRNDKAEISFIENMVEYLPANEVGGNFNPLNGSNPFCDLLIPTTTSFDPYEHFLSFDADSGQLNNVNKTILFFFTLFACVREYTIFDTLDEESQQKLLFQCCIENSEKIEAQFFKEPCRNNPGIRLAVKQAASLLMMSSSRELYDYVAEVKLSAQHSGDNSFKKLLMDLEAHFKENKPVFHSSVSLADVFKQCAEKLIDKLPENELISVIQKGHFHHSLAALERLGAAPSWNYKNEPYEAFEEKARLSQEEFKKFLNENDAVPAVQLKLAIMYENEDQKKSEEYFLKAALSEAANYLFFGEPLMKVFNSCSKERLQELSLSGNSIATIHLILLHAGDIFNHNPPKDSAVINPNIDHHLAKEYCKKIQSNLMYSDFAYRAYKML